MNDHLCEWALLPQHREFPHRHRAACDSRAELVVRIEHSLPHRLCLGHARGWINECTGYGMCVLALSIVREVTNPPSICQGEFKGEFGDGI